jgi:uncharacterized protein (DUF1330 family)
MSIFNRIMFGRYLEEQAKISSGFLGTVLSADEDPSIIEGDWPFDRTVLISFPDETTAMKWYHSDEYQRIAILRRCAAESNIIMLRGG